MTFNQIKKLKPEDFETRNDEVWAAINKLSIKQLKILVQLFDEDDIISGDIWNIIIEKEIEWLQRKINKFSTTEKEMFFDLLLIDRDNTWDIIRNLENEN